MRLALVKQFGAHSGRFDHPVYRSLAYPLTGVLWLIDEAIQTLSHSPANVRTSCSSSTGQTALRTICVYVSVLLETLAKVSFRLLDIWISEHQIIDIVFKSTSSRLPVSISAT